MLLKLASFFNEIFRVDLRIAIIFIGDLYYGIIAYFLDYSYFIFFLNFSKNIKQKKGLNTLIIGGTELWGFSALYYLRSSSNFIIFLKMAKSQLYSS